MSFFEKLDRQELRRVAEHFAVEYEEKDRKATLVKKIEADGVTEGMYRKEFNAPEPAKAITTADIGVKPVAAPAPVVENATPVRVESQVLLHMTRANGRFDVRGHTFTKTAPYQLVSSDDATFIKKHYEGFEVATPEEVADFYDLKV